MAPRKIKAKTVYEKSSKILFKQKWGIPKVYRFSPFLAGPNSPLESTQNIAKSQLKLFKKLHPQQEYQLTQSQAPEFSPNYMPLFFIITTEVGIASFSEKFQQKHYLGIEQNEDIPASYNFKIFPWLTRNLPNSFYSFEN